MVSRLVLWSRREPYSIYHMSCYHDLKKEASEKERAVNTGEKEVEPEGERKRYLKIGGCLVKLKNPPHQ